MIKAVLFDMDGTICDSFPLMIRALREATAPYVPRPITDEEFMDALGPNEAGIITNLLGDRYGEANKLYNELYGRYLPEMCPAPFDGIREIFDYLKTTGVKTALVTGKNEESCQMTLRAFGMTGVFDAVEYGSPIGSRKAEAMRIILGKFGIRPDEAIYIGDAPSDVTISHSVGLSAVSVLWAPSTDADETRLAGAEKICESTDELLAYLQEILSENRKS